MKLFYNIKRRSLILSLTIIVGFAINLYGQTLEQVLYFDFGPDDITNGEVTNNPDLNGNYWNNATISTVSGSNLSNVINNVNVATNLNFEVTKTLYKNGILNGALLSPDEALLGDVAIATATEDYFFATSAGGTLKLTGLNPENAYRFYLFGSRTSTSDRVTTFTITGLNTYEGSHQTSGTDLGGTGYHANNSTILSSEYVFPDSDGAISIDINPTVSSYAYLNLMKVEEYSSVSKIDVESIEVSGNGISVNGGSSQMSAIVSPVNATVQSVVWSVDDESIAIIDADGVLKPRGNGTVIVTATSSQEGVEISGSLEVSISNQITEMFISGLATENGDVLANASPMRMVTDLDGNISPVFEVYTSLNADGAFLLYTSNISGQGLVYGLGASAGTIVENGSSIDPVENGTVLIRADISLGTYEIIPIEKWSVVGSTILNGWDGDVPLAYQGGGIWSGDVDMTVVNSDTDPRFVFIANNDVTGQVQLELGKIENTANSLMVQSLATEQGIALSDIGLEYGNYHITLDLANSIYSIGCLEFNEARISIMGSSVAYGYAATNADGYAYMYSQLLGQRYADGEGQAWDVSNISVSGDNTPKVLARWDKDLIADCGKYVIYALSLGNEGILTYGQPKFEQFRDNMQLLINMAREVGKVPIVMNNYPRNDYTASEYEYIKQMNLLIHQWDVPSANFLGALDNESGNWVEGYWYDNGHPNTGGHTEFFHAIVPSLFDAIELGKQQPSRVSGTYVSMGKNVSQNYLVFTPEDVVHPFTVSFDIKTSSNGIISSFQSQTGTGYIKIGTSGELIYESPNGGSITGPITVNDNDWHKVTLTHYYAKGITRLYIGSIECGFVNEKLLAEEFYLNDKAAPDYIDYRDWFFYRSAMNVDEISAINEGKMLKSSLELYAPLDGQGVLGTNQLINLAQSTNVVYSTLTTSVVELDSNSSGFSIYPTLAKDKINIAGMMEDHKYECVIYRIDGSIVLKECLLNKSDVEISFLKPSTYLVHLSDDTKKVVVVQKIIKLTD